MTLLDQDDDPIEGRTVTWTIVSGDGNLTSASSVTNAAGVATMTFTAGASLGAAVVTATVVGLTPVTFNLMVQ